MKKLITIIAASTMAFCAFADQITDRMNFAKSYNIPEVPCTVTRYDVATKFDELYRTFKDKVTLSYEFGHIVKQTITDDKNKETLSFAYQYTHDSKIKSIVTNENGDIITLEIEYGTDGKEKATTLLSGEEKSLKYKILHKYEAGKKSLRLFNPNGALENVVTFTYNDKNQIESIIEYRHNGTRVSVENYSYTDSGKIASTSSTESKTDFETVTKTVYKYDKNNNLTEIQKWVKDELKERVIYKNNASGKPVKISFYDVDQKFDTTVYELTKIYEITYTE